MHIYIDTILEQQDSKVFIKNDSIIFCFFLKLQSVFW